MILVTAIITTIGTDYLRKAIESVKAQTYKNIELIVCYDGNNFNDFKEKIESEFDSLILLNVGPFNNANNARQTGIGQANGKYIALLDDDDYWHEKHIEKNIKETEKYEDRNILLVSNSILISNCQELRKLPERYYDEKNESIAEYLFFLKDNKKTLMQTSSFFFNKEVGISYPFNKKLKLHQDYDWIIRVDRSNEVLIKQTTYDTSYYVIDVNSNSISKKSRATDSLNWAVSMLSDEKKEVIFGFLKMNTLWFSRVVNLSSIIPIFKNIRKEFKLNYFYMFKILLIWLRYRISFIVKRVK